MSCKAFCTKISKNFIVRNSKVMPAALSQQPDFGSNVSINRWILVSEKCRDFHGLLDLKEKDYDLTFCGNSLQKMYICSSFINLLNFI